MARTTKPLTDTEIKQSKPRDKEYSLADGKNLYLRILPNGNKYWLLNYYRPGTQKRANVGLGTYPDTTLARARTKAAELRAALQEGVDPKEHKEERKRSLVEKHANSFEHIARKWLVLKENNISPAYYKKIKDRLERYIFPKMGGTPIHKVSAISAIEIISPLAADEKLETVKKLCRWVNEIMVYSVNTGVSSSNPLAGIGKAFNAPRTVNLPTLLPEELPELMYNIQHSSTKLITRCLIEWQLHTMVRPGEAAGAKWEEVDLVAKEWTIPAERMKKKRPHVVPLTNQSLKLLSIVQPISGKREYIFPSDHDPRRPANSQSANRALARMGFHGRLVSHGLRALASTTLNEQGFDADVIEAALAHVDKNSVRAAYNRAQYIQRRRKMMEWWSDHISKCATGQSSNPKGLKNLSLIG